ncbi:MAG: SbcC/MukB-like Walker B domain-containing protein [Planctomycetota bacterium]
MTTALASLSAKSLPLTLTVPQDGGTYRIVDRNEFAELLGENVLSDMSKYRTAVADRLFDSRDDFDLVTDLWRKAKSYRELAEAARSFDELFRQVLPAPDTDAFDKVAKGFHDIAEIEQKLADLGDDVKALHGLREIRNQARESREMLRRYRYVEAKAYADDVAAKVQSKRDEIRNSTERLGTLTQRIGQLQRESQTLDEQIKTVQANRSYQTAARLDELDTRLKGVETKITTLTTRSEEANRCLCEHQAERNECAAKTNTYLSAANRKCDELAEMVLDFSIEIAEQLLQAQRLVPADVDAELHIDAIRALIADTKLAATRTAETMQDEQHRLAGEKERLETQRQKHERELQRLEHFEDVVPELDGLDDTLDRLRQSGIDPRLLFQELEFLPEVSPELQAAVESALGISRLATIVVPPKDVERARQCVLDAGQGLRLLDANAVRRSGVVQPKEGTSLLSLVRTGNERVRTHLQATVGTLALLTQPAPDGADQHWFAIDGSGGERGARWCLELDEPRWIGERTRRQIRQREIQRLQSAIEQSAAKIEAIEGAIQRCRHARETLSELPAQLDELDLPGSLERFRSSLHQLAERIDDSDRRVAEIENDLGTSRYERDRMAETIADLQKQLKGFDVVGVKKRLDDLSETHRKTIQAIGGCHNEEQATQQKLNSLDAEVASAETELAETHALVADARDELVTVLPPGIEDLDHYVFSIKRASQIKDLPARISEAVAKEAGTTERLRRGSDGVMNQRFATRYRFRVDDPSGWIEVRDHKDQSLDEILHERDETERHWREALKKKNVELVEQILAHSLTEQLRGNIRMLQRTRDGLNRVLQDLPFGNSRFQLKAKVTPDHAPLVQLIERQSLLDAEQRKELREHLENRREQLVGEGEIPPFLDYRTWYTYQFQLQHCDSDNVVSLGSDALVRGSGGAQGTHHYLLLFALARLLFDRSGAHVRLLMMDEAFYGVDMQRKELLLRCAKQLHLDLVVASPDLDGTILEDASDSTTVMVEKDEHGDVTLLPLMWKKREPQAELFPEPRPEAVIGHETDE